MLPDVLPARVAVLLMLCAGGLSPAWGRTPESTEGLRAQIEALRAEQARIAEMQQQTDAKLRALEAGLSARVSAQATPGPAPSTAAADDTKPRLNISGDMRLRYQGDYSDEDAPARDSSQVRARLGATYLLNDRITLGARLVTGDPDDPNSTDVQLSNFDDDLQVSLDLAYAQLKLGDLSLYGGKIPQPFARTDLVWDGDVNPQGLSAVYKHPLSGGSAFRASSLFFVVDENAAAADSTMVGAQVGYDFSCIRQLEVRRCCGVLRLSTRQRRRR